MASYSPTLRLISLAAFTSTASMRVCDPMLIAVGNEFQVSTGDASAIVSAFAVAYGLLQLFYGPLGDRLGKLRVIMVATFGCAVFSALTAFAPTFGLLIVCRAAMGAAAAGIIPLTIAWVGDQVAYGQRQEALARLMGATLTGMMVGQWFGGYAAQTLGWRVAFIVLGVLFLLAASVLYVRTRADRAAADATAVQALPLSAYLRQSLRLLQLPRVRWVLAVTALEGVLAYGALAFFPSRLVEHFGFSVAAAGGTMMLFAVGGLAYAQFAGRWLGLLGERGLALLGGSLVALCLAALAWSQVAGVAMAGCLLAGLGLYMLHNTLQTQATQMAPEARGAAVTLFACALFMGQSVGVLAMGALLDRAWLAPGFVVTALGLLALGIWISRHVRPRVQVQVQVQK